MKKSIFVSIIIVSSATLILSTAVIMSYLYKYFAQNQERNQISELDLAIEGVKFNGTSYLQNLHKGDYRFTWIDSSGNVLFDTDVAAAKTENHATRSEIQDASATGFGKSVRFSETMFTKTIYIAKKIAATSESDFTILRIATSTKTVASLLLGVLPATIAVFLVALLLSIILAFTLSRRIVKPLNNLNLDKPLENNCYDEIAPLLIRVNKQKMQIAEQIATLKEKSAEFTKITDCMAEGLVLINKTGTIISINRAAKNIFALEDDVTGRDIITICRDYGIQECIKTAFSVEHSETQKIFGAKTYQLNVSRIDCDGDILGEVLLLFDITQKICLEQNRREFTANVSHELKTPLQGIMGSAELLQNNMVKSGDIPKFVSHIYSEASRLVSLVDDILKLSRLDEDASFEKENVNFLSLLNDVATNLKPLAQKKKITISVSGDDTQIFAVKKLLYEIAFNLCDNAVKYNVKGGSVQMSVTKTDAKIVLSVSDTGQGIPSEHIERIFERFYRVDKSHSKESGGTGLGLSIVKHAVQYHHGTISVKSTVGQGTTFTVELPAIS